jgi:hypothetical protein
MMMAERVIFTHEGVEYEVQDFRIDGIHEKRVKLNSRHAEMRYFIPPDGSGVPTRQYVFRGGINYGRSDEKILAEQFKFSAPVRRLR